MNRDADQPEGVETAPELRTFLFADVRGYTRFTQERGDQAAAQLVSRFAALMREVVADKGGRLVELRGDEALSVFSSAQQALRAAVALQARFAVESEADPALPLAVGMGLDAGEAIPFEDGYRGEAVNLAARLCNLAGPGEILASEGVVYLGRRLQGVSYAERGRVPLKGFADAVRVIRVVGQSSGAPAEDPDTPAAETQGAGASPDEPLPIGVFLGALPSGALIGRAEEWEQVMATLEAVMQDSGRLITLAGEPGVGKTRLAQEVTLKARHWGFLVATGRCYEPEQAVPYYPFLEALSALYQSCPPDIRADVPRRWPQLGRLLPDEIGLLPVVSSEPHEEQSRLFRAVTGFLNAIAPHQPVALLLDDLHWADDSSIKLLQHLARNTRGQRVLIFGTYRNVQLHRQHPLDAALVDLDRERLLQEIQLRRLDQDGTRALMAEILGDKEDLTALAELVYRRTEGNAFFIQEVVRVLVEQGDVYRKDGKWGLRRVREMEVPKSIRAVIGQRLSRLSPEAQEILRTASVLGQSFTFDDLLALGRRAPRLADRSPFPPPGGAPAEWSEDQVDAALGAAMEAGLVRETEHDSYAFNHAITQQALYAELSTRRKKRLHLAAGQVLEEAPPEGAHGVRAHPNRWAELAWHFLEGDAPEQALVYSVRAGDQAEEVYAHGEAERHYRTALELARELGDTARESETLEKLAGVLSTVGRYDDALERLEEAAALYNAAGNVEAEHCAIAMMGHVHFQRGTPGEGIAMLQPLVDSLDGEPARTVPTFSLAALYAALARLYLGVDSYSRYKKQLRAAERAVELAQAIGNDHLLIGATITLGDALWGLGEDESAIRVQEGVIPRAEAAGDLDNLARALSNLAMYWAGRGELTRDREYHQRMLKVAERRGDRGHILLATISLSENAFLMGDWEQSHRYLDRAESIIRTMGTTRFSTWPVIARGWLCLREGDTDGAARLAQETLRLAEGTGSRLWALLAERLLAERALLENRPDEALIHLEAVQEGEEWKEDPGFLSNLAWVHLALGEEQGSRSIAAKAITQATARKSQPDLVEALIVQGLVLARLGRWGEARETYEYCLSVARRMPFPFGEARALQAYAELESQVGDQESAYRMLYEAVAIFQRLGARKDVERAQQLLRAEPQTAGGAR